MTQILPKFVNKKDTPNNDNFTSRFIFEIKNWKCNFFGTVFFMYSLYQEITIRLRVFLFVFDYLFLSVLTFVCIQSHMLLCVPILSTWIYHTDILVVTLHLLWCGSAGESQRLCHFPHLILYLTSIPCLHILVFKIPPCVALTCKGCVFST